METVEFLRLLAQHKANAVPAPLRQATVTSLVSGWLAILTHAAMHAYAASLLCLPEDGAIPTTTALHYTTLQYNYAHDTLHYNTLHYTTLWCTTLQHTTIHHTSYTTPHLQLQLPYVNYTSYITLQSQLATAVPLRYNYTYNYNYGFATPHYIQQVQPLQPL